MNRAATFLGLVLAVTGVALFLGIFVGSLPYDLAAVLAVIALPVGSALAFYGSVFSGSFEAQGRPMAVSAPARGSTGVTYAAIGVAIIAVILALASVSLAYSNQGAVSSVSSKVNQVNGVISGLNGSASVNVQPTKIAYKIDWCNSDPTGQDRFCPYEIVANQGDIVQIMFISNDSDSHTFTMIGSPYQFQINDSVAGMRNFLNNVTYSGPCSNSGTYAQQVVNISGTLCVSGPSLLPTSTAGTFRVAQNPTPANPFTPGSPSVVLVPVDNKLHNNFYNGTVAEVWGIGAFQASQPGIYEFFCHYHVSNGMFGYLIVLPNAYCNAHAAACGIKTAG